jgi:hypothetical protein
MVRAGRAQLADFRRARAVHVIEHRIARIDGQDGAATARYSAPDDRQDVGQQRFTRIGRERLDAQIAEHALPAPLLGQVCFGLTDDGDGVIVGGFALVSPRHQPVLAHDDAFDARTIAHRIAHLAADPLAEREAGANVGHPRHAVAIHRARGRFAIGRARQADERIGMCVIDMRERHEGVQQRFDALARAAGFEHGAFQIRRHRLVGHRFAREERLDLVHAQQRELRPGDGEDIGTRCFHSQHLHGAAGVIGHIEFGAGVPAVDVHDRAVAAEQVAAVDEAIEIRQGGGFSGVPQIRRHEGSFGEKKAFENPHRSFIYFRYLP